MSRDADMPVAAAAMLMWEQEEKSLCASRGRSINEINIFRMMIDRRTCRFGVCITYICMDGGVVEFSVRYGAPCDVAVVHLKVNRTTAVLQVNAFR